jgi:phosphoribosylaminoimidazolecarboxamide formyltransferase/IMP cyclohydrolase
MSTTKTIQLISVFSKEGLEPIVRLLNSQNVTLILQEEQKIS